MVGDGSIGSPSDHMRSFQLSHASLSACHQMFKDASAGSWSFAAAPLARDTLGS
jgi:hypothetical protein